jgi:type I restriction enzyme R subunit
MQVEYMKLTSEAAFEAVVAKHLIEKNGFLRAMPDEYDRELCMLPQVLVRFLQVSQPEKWKAYTAVHGPDAATRITRRAKEVVERNSTLHLLRKGLDESGHHFDICYFKPSSGLNPDLQKLYKGNLFHVLYDETSSGGFKYSLETEQSVDLGLFINGLPVFTSELKNELSGQTVLNAISQYRNTRSPKEPLFKFARCLAHFAVDTADVAMASALTGSRTKFFPFNMGHDNGRGNPPSATGIATAYLWEKVWTKESILDLVQRFVQIVDAYDKNGRRTGKKTQIFPRYHQLKTVRQLCDHAQQNGAGHSYLNQHSAGSGKTIEIATLASSLSMLHGADNKPVFNTVLVLSDRRVIDRMLQRTLAQFIQTRGVLENIDSTSRDLKSALQDGKKVVVSTVQKFPHIIEDLVSLPQQSFAVIIDEAHSSQAGKTAGKLNQVLSYAQDAIDSDFEEELETCEDTVDAKMLELMKRRARMSHVSFFAFTATPKEETLQLFGEKMPDGGYKETTLYSMRQAIEEGFILDVLKNYTTYNQYFDLLKKSENDPHVDKRKALRLLRRFVHNERLPIQRKARIMVDHFMTSIMHEQKGRAKAMVVSRSRLHAVRYMEEISLYLKELNAPFKAMVAFTDTVKDPKTGDKHTEAGMNGMSERMTEDAFDTDEFRFLIVANKFQTGFDQPLLSVMYVDRRLQDVGAVQTLSRLNRCNPSTGKKEVYVLDFESENLEPVTTAFQKYYDRVELVSGTDPNRLYDIRNEILESGLMPYALVDDFAKVAYGSQRDETKLKKLHALLNPVVQEFSALERDDQRDLKSKISDYIKCYGFLCQIIPFSDVKLEKLYELLTVLVKKLVIPGEKPPYEILSSVDLDHFKPELIGAQDIELQRGVVKEEPTEYGQGVKPEPPDEPEPLSKIIQELNDRFATNFSDEDRAVIKNLSEQIDKDEALGQQIPVVSKEAARLSYEQVAHDRLHELIESNFRFYRKVQDDTAVSKMLFDHLFEKYYQQHAGI